MNIRRQLITKVITQTAKRPFIWKSVTAEPQKLEEYSTLRIYQDKSFSELINLYVVNSFCRNNFLVDNSEKLYNLSNKILGENITNSIIKNTMGKVFTAGSTLHDLEKTVLTLNLRQISVVIDYACEAILGGEVNEAMMKHSTDRFLETIDVAKKIGTNIGNTVSMKCSPLIQPMLLMKINKNQQTFLNAFTNPDFSYKAELKASQIRDYFKNLKYEFEDTDFAEYLSLILGKTVNANELDNTTITQFEWRLNTHAYYYQQPEKNKNKFFNIVASYTDREVEQIEHFLKRMNAILAKATEAKLRVLVDAEQSYWQSAIDSFTQQFSNIYNKEQAVVYNTFQNYLITTQDRLKFEVERCKHLNLPFASKLVRGAYIVEETNLAKKNNTRLPCLPSVLDTHQNYNTNLEFLINNLGDKSGLFIASHNEESVKLGQKLVSEKGLNKRQVSFAQLQGLGDHLTYGLLRQGYPVYKLTPFGDTHIMIPYLIRRAQESKQMLASTSLQRKLMSDEILRRLKLK
jgi:proline dehydrogenase